MKNKWCPKCKITKLPSDKFCEECGTELINQSECECGNPIYAHYKFCTQCGKEIVK